MLEVEKYALDKSPTRKKRPTTTVSAPAAVNVLMVARTEEPALIISSTTATRSPEIFCIAPLGKPYSALKNPEELLSGIFDSRMSILLEIGRPFISEVYTVNDEVISSCK